MFTLTQLFVIMTVLSKSSLFEDDSDRTRLRPTIGCIPFLILLNEEIILEEEFLIFDENKELQYYYYVMACSFRKISISFLK
jgi:hypothetical protein